MPVWILSYHFEVGGEQRKDVGVVFKWCLDVQLRVQLGSDRLRGGFLLLNCYDVSLHVLPTKGFYYLLLEFRLAYTLKKVC